VRGRDGGGTQPCSAARADHADALSKEAGTLSDKFAGLARSWRGNTTGSPVRVLRSVGDVFNLIVTEERPVGRNSYRRGRGQGGRGAQVTEPESCRKR